MDGTSNARIRLALKVLAWYDFGKKEALTADDIDSLKICLGRDAGRMSFGRMACAVIERELDALKRTHAEGSTGALAPLVETLTLDTGSTKPGRGMSKRWRRRETLFNR